VGEWLARAFIDYEPGIHWSQMQMQAGTTGINTTRVYNPIKQARDHDPKGRFVRHWLPALARVPDAWLFEPWRMPPDIQARCGVRVGVDIPCRWSSSKPPPARPRPACMPCAPSPKCAPPRPPSSPSTAPAAARTPRRGKRPPAAQLALDL
jgi:deoxyribodipyrimidine photo-lyase